jgi:hypothetical protein
MGANLIDILNQNLNKRKKARSSLKEFVVFTKKNYDLSQFHEWISTDLDEFVHGNIAKMMVFAPP